MDPNTTPGLSPPAGVEPNFVDPYSLQPQRIAVSIVGFVVLALSVIIRVYARVRLGKFNIDDWVFLLAGACFATIIALLIVAGAYGDGTHQWNVTVAELKKVLLFHNLIEIVYAVTMVTIKYVILRQIQSIFFPHDHSPLASRAILLLIWANILLYTSLGLSIVLQCVPREKIWNTEIEGTCINTNVSITVVTALNVISDISISVIPVVSIWKLRLSSMKKLKASAVFAVGIFAIVASIIRLYYGLQLFYTNDVTWAASPMGQWSIVEFITGFLVACFPYVPYVFETLLGRREKTPSMPAPWHGGGSHNPTKPRNPRIRVERSWKTLKGQEEESQGISYKVTVLMQERDEMAASHSNNGYIT
ncbi:hypothetical protein F5X98DRAFT_375676 [Xylaria grammica]|nr:hypothetical protein F5X98DRAFT_375676 [Xylaria grammica]